jgi:hypothetical protein
MEADKMRHILIIMAIVLCVCGVASSGETLTMYGGDWYYGPATHETTCDICGLPIHYTEYPTNNFIYTDTYASGSEEFSIHGPESGTSYDYSDSLHLCDVCREKFGDQYSEYMESARAKWIQKAKSESKVRIEAVNKALNEKEIREAKDELERLKTKQKELEEFLND